MVESLVVLGLLALVLGPITALYTLLKNQEKEIAVHRNEMNYQMCDLEDRVLEARAEFNRKLDELEDNTSRALEWEKQMKESQLMQPSFLEKVSL